MAALSSYPPDLQRRLLRLWRPKSIQWAFRHSHGLDRQKPHQVEVRLNLPTPIGGFDQIDGWEVAKINSEDGMLFIRRKQPLTNRALRTMFRDALIVAHAHGGGFHSWMHEPELMDWD